MGFTTLGGFTTAQADANGIIPFGTSPYQVPTGNDWINSFLDTQQVARYESLCGVLEGGVCTVAALIVTVPTGTIYVAGGMVWKTTSSETKQVTDGSGSPATTYLWGCCDGELRTTSDTTPPPGFEGNKSCVITKTSALNGVATLDNSVQQKAQYASHTARFVSPSNLGLFATPKRVPTGGVAVIPDGSYLEVRAAISDFIVQGTAELILRGDAELIITGS